MADFKYLHLGHNLHEGLVIDVDVQSLHVFAIKRFKKESRKKRTCFFSLTNQVGTELLKTTSHHILGQRLIAFFDLAKRHRIF